MRHPTVAIRTVIHPPTGQGAGMRPAILLARVAHAKTRVDTNAARKGPDQSELFFKASHRAS